MSLCMIDLSLEPVDKNLEFQATVPILPSWPGIDLMILHLLESQICKTPEFVPTARCEPLLDHWTLVTESEPPKS